MPNPKETVNQTASRIETNFKLVFQYSLLLELSFFNFLKNFFNVQKTIKSRREVHFFNFNIQIFENIRSNYFKIIVVNNRFKYIFAHSLIKWSGVIITLLLISIKASQIINRIQIIE